MSALLLACDPDPVARARDAGRMRASLERQGLPHAFGADWQGITLGWHETPGAPQSRAQWLPIEDGLIACVGTLFRDGRCGPEALASLWRDFDGAGCAASSRLAGEYQVVLAKRGRIWVFGDPLGMIKRYESADGRLASTSWLACADAQPRLNPDPVGALDYLFHGANHGLRTACEQVRIADPAEVRELVQGTRDRLFGPACWAADGYFSDRGEALDRIQARLMALAQGWATAFPGRLRSALSGGYDSRLLLAAARATGQRPALHVYGSPDSADVRTALAIDRALGLGLRAIDKEALERERGGEPDLDANLDFFDGLPIDGILDRGTDRTTRIAQSAQGALALNGGGGEVLRDFFHLGPAGLRARDLVRVFWGGIDPAAVRRRELLTALDEHLAATIGAELGHGGRLTRQEIELAYPLLRGRYWTSRNNAMAARCGHFLTPLLDPQLVRDAARLPLAWKRHGRFEGALIARLAPDLAALPLADGHTPAQGPGLRQKMITTLLDHRPPWLRQASARLRAQRSSARSGQDDDDESFPRMGRLVDPSRLRAPALRARLITLERLLGRHPAP